MTDTIRSGLKALALKKISLARSEAIYRVGKTSVLLTAVIVCSIATVVLTGLAFSGVVAIPMVAFVLPAFGMLGLAAALCAVGLIRFYRRSPNLFKEYLRGSFLKLAAYNVPKSMLDLRRTMTAVKMLRNTMAASKLRLQEAALADGSPQKEKTLEKLAKLDAKADKLYDRMQKLETQIRHWEEKIKPVASHITMAKWKDFLKDHPKMMAKGEGNEAIIQTLQEFAKGLMADTSLADEDILRITKEHMGDLSHMQEPEVLAAVWRFAPAA
jgi:hypothetical protein